MDYEGLVLDKEAGVATLTLNRPQQLNALTIPMIYSLKEALNDVEMDDSVKVLILTGAGRGFSAGGDVSSGLPELSKMSPEELCDVMRTLTLPLYNLSKFTIAAINGVAVGAGLSLALLCDMRIASEKAKFSSGYIKMGLTPDAGSTYSLSRLVGMAKAMEIMVTGDTFDAAEAHRIGLVNRVVPEEEVMKIAREMADRIAKGPSIAVKLTKQITRKGIQNSLEPQIELEASSFFTCLRTDDVKEAARAFREKRQPEFKGK